MGNLVTRMYRMAYPKTLFQQLESTLTEIQSRCDSVRLKIESNEFIESLHREELPFIDYLKPQARAGRLSLDFHLSVHFRSKLNSLNEIIVHKVKLFNCIHNLKNNRVLDISEHELENFESIILQHFKEICAKAFMIHVHLLAKNHSIMEEMIGRNECYAYFQENKSIYFLQLQTFCSRYTSDEQRIRLLPAIDALMKYLDNAMESPQLPAPVLTLKSSKLLTIETPARTTHYDDHNHARLVNRISQQMLLLQSPSFDFLNDNVDFQSKLRLINLKLSNELLELQMNLLKQSISSLVEQTFETYSEALPKLFDELILSKDVFSQQFNSNKQAFSPLMVHQLTSDIEAYMYQTYTQSYLFFMTLAKFYNNNQANWDELNIILDCENIDELFLQNDASFKTELANLMHLNSENNILLEQVNSLLQYIEKGVKKYTPQNEGTNHQRMTL